VPEACNHGRSTVKKFLKIFPEYDFTSQLVWQEPELSDSHFCEKTIEELKIPIFSSSDNLFSHTGVSPLSRYFQAHAHRS
jgi:hypothetical protein